MKLMRKNKKILTGLVAGVMLLSTGCGNTASTTSANVDPTTATESAKDSDKKSEAPVVIRYGSHCANEENPNYKDPVSGEYAMSEEEREKKLAVLDHIKETLNVDFQFVQYPGDTGEVLLQSVMAGDPVCDVARIYTYGAGGILGQNVLQPLDQWADLLGDPAPPKVFDKSYFIRIGGDRTHTFLPLMYNISYLEAVPALKENGKTVYPTDLYKEGKWTFSTFKDYLSKIDAYYKDSQAPVRPERRIQAFWSSAYDLAPVAVHAAGGSIYGRNGFNVESPETIMAVEYVEDLINSGLVYVEGNGLTNDEIVNGRSAIKDGESVFVLVEDWKAKGFADQMAERGESMGYIPFPRADQLAADDPNYQQVRIPGESYAVLKGVDEEIVPLAIQATLMWLDSETGEPKEETAERPTPQIAMDIFHPEIGQDMIDIYWETRERTVVNELADLFSISGKFARLVTSSIYGLDGTPRYPVAIQQQKGMLEESINVMRNTLDSGKVKDNVKPVFTKVNEGNFVYPVGTDLNAIDWQAEFTAKDNIDGDLDMTTATFEFVDVDMATAAHYEAGLVAKISDKSENIRESKYNITLYDPNNTTAPTLTAFAEFPSIKLEADPNKINWSGDFIEVAEDTNGINIKSLLQADLSNLDTATAGTYEVPISVTDYVGNTSNIVINVVVE